MQTKAKKRDVWFRDPEPPQPERRPSLKPGDIVWLAASHRIQYQVMAVTGMSVRLRRVDSKDKLADWERSEREAVVHRACVRKVSE